MGRMLSDFALWHGQRSECADLSELLRLLYHTQKQKYMGIVKKISNYAIMIEL